MESIFLETKPDGWETFAYSNGWAWNFCRRYRISDQCKTDSKSEPRSVREPRIRLQHMRYLALQNVDMNIPQDPFWGNFPPELHFSWDQIPAPFAVPCGRSLNPVNTPCHVNAMEFLGGTGKAECGLTRRQASVHLTIRAVGPQIVPPVIILKGVDVFRTREELEAFERLHCVRVYFQKKAWADTPFLMWYVTEVFVPALRAAGIYRPVLAVMDGLSSHETPAMRALMQLHGIIPFVTAAGCTDVAAPVDRHVGAFLKTTMRVCYKSAVKADSHLWRGTGPGGLASVATGSAASRRRVLMAQWVEQAWGEIVKREYLLFRAFVGTGCLMGRKGENGISMRGFGGYHILAELSRSEVVGLECANA
jgi:hypothetical protein